MKRLMCAIILGVLTLSFSSLVGYENCIPACSQSNPWALAFIPSVGYTGGRGISYNGGYASAEGFLALYHEQLQCYPFLDFQFNRISNGRQTYNVGVGWRTLTSNRQEMLGINLYYDGRKAFNDYLQQMSVGVEFLGRCLDLRANGYWPIGDKRALVETTVFEYPGDFIAIRDEFRGARWGFDLEVGRCLFSCGCLSFYGAVGPYFYGAKCCESLVGAMGRVETWICNQFRLEGVIYHDRIYGTNLQGALYLYLPFPLCLRKCWLCLFPPVQRNPIPVLERFCDFETNF
ncbi:MAG: hypothetical protein S4CHLAM2_03870 [Chlamydiales bacterium]|nr:hypothetical protein [Chlamydiales bacterium]